MSSACTSWEDRQAQAPTEMSNEMEQVVQALHILYAQHTAPDDRRKADQWLTQLRQSPEAWKVPPARPPISAQRAGSWLHDMQFFSVCASQISVDAIQAPNASEDVTVFAAQAILCKVALPASC